MSAAKYALELLKVIIAWICTLIAFVAPVAGTLRLIYLPQKSNQQELSWIAVLFVLPAVLVGLWLSAKVAEFFLRVWGTRRE